MKDFDSHLAKLLKAHPKARREYDKLFSELPLPTRQAILRRRKKIAATRAA